MVSAEKEWTRGMERVSCEPPDEPGSTNGKMHGDLLSREKSIHLVTPLLEKEEAVTSIIVYGEVA
jgi:hypothetical protein